MDLSRTSALSLADVGVAVGDARCTSVKRQNALSPMRESELVVMTNSRINLVLGLYLENIVFTE